MATLQDAIDYIQRELGQLPGIRNNPSYPPEKGTPYPFVVTYPRSGTWGFGPGGGKQGLHSICVEIHVERKNLPYDVKDAMQFSESVPNALLKDPTLGKTVSTFSGITYEFGAMAWAGRSTIGWRFLLNDVKIQTDIM